MKSTRIATIAALGAITGVTAAALALAGCTSLERYSVRAAEASCADVEVCTVDGPGGEQLLPCTSTPDERVVYPGDVAWPYTTPGVCDTVQDGRVVSTRALEPASPQLRPEFGLGY